MSPPPLGLEHSNLGGPLKSPRRFERPCPRSKIEKERGVGGWFLEGERMRGDVYFLDEGLGVRGGRRYEMRRKRGVALKKITADEIIGIFVYYIYECPRGGTNF